MKKANTVVLALVIVGAINWGLKGAVKLDVVEYVFGGSLASRAIYVVVGLAGIWALTFFGKVRK